jgi:positive regulator of sigma E activity
MYSRHSENETGLVVALEGDQALVELAEQSACQSCGARILCVPDAKGKRRIKVSNPLRAQVGNRVEITEASQFLLKLSAMQFGIPLIGFLAGLYLIHLSGLSIDNIPSEVIAFSGGLLGLAAGALLSRYWAGRMANQEQHFLSIHRIISY